MKPIPSPGKLLVEKRTLWTFRCLVPDCQHQLTVAGPRRADAAERATRAGWEVSGSEGMMLPSCPSCAASRHPHSATRGDTT